MIATTEEITKQSEMQSVEETERVLEIPTAEQEVKTGTLLTATAAKADTEE